jgi:hypothetical protein
MELKGNGLTVQVNPAEQSNEWLVGAAQEIADAAKERGLELPFATGSIAVEGAMQSETHENPTHSTKESLSEQLATTYIGYNVTTGLLNEGRRKKDQVPIVKPETLREELDAWLTEEKVAYIATAQEADPEVRFTLVATPNVLVNDRELANAAKEFGKGQPYETYVWDSLYSRYTPEQISGMDPSNGKAVMFSLIPSKYTPGMDGTVVEQQAELAKLKADTPDLKVPSPLEAVTYWQTLRAQGYQLRDKFTFGRTYIRHFNLPEQRVDDWLSLSVPASYVGDDGKPILRRSRAQNDNLARVAVG